jgi:hypothetical protein
MEPLRHFAIAGGGSAGWMSAAAMVNAMRGAVRVTLVESDAGWPMIRAPYARAAVHRTRRGNEAFLKWRTREDEAGNRYVIVYTI